MSVSRRKFLINSSILGSIPILKNFTGLAASELNDTKNLYLTLSGHFKSEDTLGISILQGDKSIADTIYSIRESHNYRSVIKYKSTDFYKLYFCRDIIDFFVDHSDLRLYVKTVDNPKSILKNQSPISRINYRLNLYNQLLTAMNLSGNNPTIKVKAESPFGPSRSFKDKIKTDDGVKFKLEAIKTYEDDILQMSSFLVGTIIGDMRGKASNLVKTELINYLKTKLGTSSFEPGANYQDKIFII